MAVAVPFNFPNKTFHLPLFAVIQLGNYLLSNSQLSWKLFPCAGTITCAALMQHRHQQKHHGHRKKFQLNFLGALWNTFYILCGFFLALIRDENEQLPPMYRVNKIAGKLA